MKILAESFKSALTAESSTLTWCWLVERQDGVKLGFTSFDLMLIIDGVNYEPFTGFAPSADDSVEGLERNNSQSLGGIITSEQITDTDLIAGKYQKATITCFIVNVVDLPVTLADEPPNYLLKYKRVISKINITDKGFSFETRDTDYKFKAKIGKQTSKFCGHNLGDSKCKVDLNQYTFNEAITDVTSRFTFRSTGGFVPGQFDRGTVTFTSGANAGIKRDIATFTSNNEIRTFQPFPYNISLEDSITLVQGCGKTLFDCIVRYNNVVNCDCDPHIPTVEQATT